MVDLRELVAIKDLKIFESLRKRQKLDNGELVKKVRMKIGRIV